MLTNTSHSLLDRLKTRSSTEDWRLFVDIYKPFITIHFNRMGVTSSDSDDLCQETLTQVFKGLSNFDHNGRTGAFRNWLKKIIRQKLWKFAESQKRTARTNSIDKLQIENGKTGSLFDQHWDREHDRHVVNRLLEIISKEFTKTSWESFRRVVLQGNSASDVAGELSVSVNSVLIAKSRIMKRLRELGSGLIDTW